MSLTELHRRILFVDPDGFDALAMEVFRYQSENCEVYKQYLTCLNIDITKISDTSQIPFLPIEFFKSFVISDSKGPFDAVFESSSTGNQGASRHYVKDIHSYEAAFTKSFNFAFGDPAQYCHLALLPSYLERGNSSLIYQVNRFVASSQYSQSAFFLDQHEQLKNTLLENQEHQIPTILWGVTYALLDFVESYNIHFPELVVMETGGMKGRRKEIIRQELHNILGPAFGVNAIAGEYGMTELMSQAYARKEGLYQCPPQMKIIIREINDPFSQPLIKRHGAVNVIDLANLHSCSFIATSDLGRLTDENTFEISGRMDHSDTRGCNLMVS